MRKLFIIFISYCFFLLVIFRETGVIFAQSPNTITINPSVTYQTFAGWEATDYVGSPESPLWPSFPYYKNILYDKVVNDYGINRIRLEVVSALENPTDYYAQFLANPTGTINGHPTQWQWVHVNSPKFVNDDGDSTSVRSYISANPTSANIPGFTFHSLDTKIDNSVVDLQNLVQAKGEKLLINVTYVGFHTPSTGIDLYNNPAEYAEYMLAIFQHMKVKYGFFPDTIEVELEPDNTAFDATKIGNAIKSTIPLLATYGFTPKYVVPCTTNMTNAVSYFDTIKSILGASLTTQYIQEICYHRYAGVSSSSLSAIANRSVSNNIGTSMLEWWNPNNTYQTLHEDLTTGRNTAWQEGTILGLYNIYTTNPTSPVVTIADKSKFIRQYTKFIRPAAVRIGATGNATFDPVAFINTGNKYVVVVKAATGGNFSVSGLPASTYGIKYTTATQYDNNLADQTIFAGTLLTTNIPEAGVITVYAKSAISTTPTATLTPIPTPTYLPGDIDRNHKIDIFDYNLLVTDFGKTGTTGFSPADLIPDGKVDIFDYNILVGDFGK